MVDDLQGILLRGFESKDVDYKAPMTWDENDKKSCCELVKDILGMANTLGGYIVIGVSESGTGFVYDGLTHDQAASFETSRLNRFLQNYVDPPINTVLRKMEHNGKAFVVIGVPKFNDTPHVCQKDYPGVLTAPTLYVRTDNNETAPLRSSADFRSIVEHAIRNRSDRLLTSFRAILTGGEMSPGPTDEQRFRMQFLEALNRFEAIDPLKEKGYTGFREVAFHPARFEPSRFSLDELRLAAGRASIDFRGWPFLFVSRQRDETYAIQDGLETLVAFPDFGANDRTDFWRLQQSGFFYQRVLMWEESYQRKREQPPALDITAMAMYAGEAIHCLIKLYEDVLDDNEEVQFRLRILGTEGRQLQIFGHDRLPLHNTYGSRVPEIHFDRRRPLAEWRAATVDHAVEVCKEVFLRFNWDRPNLDAAREIIEKMFARRL